MGSVVELVSRREKPEEELSPWRVGQHFVFDLGRFNHSSVAQYVLLLGDSNPIHTIPQAAEDWCRERGIKNLPLGEVIVPGMQILSRLPGKIVDEFGRLSSIINLRTVDFMRPGFTGPEKLEGLLEITEISYILETDWEMSCTIEVTAFGPKRSRNIARGEFRMRTPKKRG